MLLVKSLLCDDRLTG